MRALLLAVTILAAGCFASIPAGLAYSDELHYSATVVGQRTEGSDAVIWTYSIENSSTDENYSLWLLAVEVDKECNVLDVSFPSGWAADTSQDHFITWICTENDLAAGQKAQGFSVVFDRLPEIQTYEAMFNNTETGEYPTEIGNVSLIVPEPGSVIALLGGLAPLLACALRKRK